MPGISDFHFILFVSLQLTGGSPARASPVAKGPRHLGQFSSFDVSLFCVFRQPEKMNSNVKMYICTLII
jgi:hypothetical protein